MEIPIYQFEDGWQIRRVIGSDQKEKLFPGVSFGIVYSVYDKKSVRSKIHLAKGHDGYFAGSLDDSRTNGFDDEVEKHRISFVLEILGETYDKKIAKLIVPYPDALIERFRSFAEKEHEIWKQMKLMTPESTKTGRDIAKKIILKSFEGMVEFDVGTPQLTWNEVRVNPTGHLLFIRVTESGWTIGSNPHPFKSLQTLWNEYEMMADESGYELTPYSQVDAWWDRNTVAGHPLFDVEAYELLGAESPFLYDDKKFVEWVNATS